MWRLTLNGGALDPQTWGVFADGGPRAYTPLISAFGDPSVPVGPVVGAPALTTDDDHNLWVYFGTGRFFANQDNITTDPQRLFGVKDLFMSQGSPGQTAESNDLFDVTDVKICVEDCGAPGSGLEPILATLQHKAGWVVRLKAEPRERSLGAPVVFGGLVFFSSYSPPEDICGQGGNSRLYAMFFRSGTGTPQGVLGTTTDASRKIANIVGDARAGISFTPEPHFGQPNQPDGSVVCVSSGLGHGDIAKTCLTGLTPVALTSRFTTWRDI
jgi:type IV pilus assembly protein PilY1